MADIEESPEQRKQRETDQEQHKMDWSKGAIVLVAGAIYIAFCFLAHKWYRQELWDYSIDSFIPWMQSMPSWVLFFLQYFYWFSDEGIWVFLLLFYAYFNRAASIYLFTSISLLGVVNELLKIYFMDGRPFYMVEGFSIQGYDCDNKDFGRPAGHLFSSSTILVIIFLQYFDPHDIRGSFEILYRRSDGEFDDAGRQDQQHFKFRNNTFCISFWVFALLGAIMIGWFAEVGTGANSWDQVIFGTSLGLGFIFTWYVLRDDLCIFFIRVTEQCREGYEKFRAIVFLVVSIVVYLVAVLFSRWFSINRFNEFENVSPLWVDEYESMCGKLTHPSWFYLHLQNIYAYSFFFLGTVVGVVIDHFLLGGTIINYNKTSPVDGDGENIPWKGMCRTIIAGVILYGFKFLWEHFFVGKMSNLFTHVWWYFFVPIILFTVVKYIYRALGLSKQYVTFDELEVKWNQDNNTRS